jgi:hypothetical protein
MEVLCDLRQVMALKIATIRNMPERRSPDTSSGTNAAYRPVAERPAPGGVLSELAVDVDPRPFTGS